MKTIIPSLFALVTLGCAEAADNLAPVSDPASVAESVADAGANEVPAAVPAPSAVAETAADRDVITTSTGWRIVLADGRATATKGRRTVALFADRDEEGSGEWSRITSVVGSIVSISSSYYSEGAAHAYYGTTWKAVDLETGELAKLAAVFPEDEILAVLRGDSVVKEAYMEDLLGEPGSLEELIGGLDGGCAMSFSDEMLSQFAFHHTRGDQVAVRIGLTHGCEVQRGNFTQLGLYLSVPPALSEPLARAKADGTLMEDMGAQ